jgi:membrane fusion protein (multidrug efflux system)
MFLTVLVLGCSKKEENGAAQAKPGGPPKAAPAAGGPPPGVPVKAQPVKVASADSQVTAVGTLLSAESVTIRPEIAGRIVDLHIKEGQAVAKGTPLVVLDDSEYRAQLAGSTANAKTEAQRYDRAKELMAKNFISQEAVDVAKGNMDRALSRKRQDETLVAKAVIHAPFSGVLGLRRVSPGAYVKAGDDIVQLDNIASLKLDFRVPESYTPKLKTGQSVHIRVDAFPNDTFEGTIYALDPAMDEKTRTVQARAQIPNPQLKLKPGMFARVAVLLETRENAILVPEQAIWPQGRETFVYRVVEGKAALTKIEIGTRRPGEVEVLSGLKPDDLVVTDGQIKIKDGAPVTVLPEQSPAVTPAAPAAKAG